MRETAPPITRAREGSQGALMGSRKEDTYAQRESIGRKSKRRESAGSTEAPLPHHDFSTDEGCPSRHKRGAWPGCNETFSLSVMPLRPSPAPKTAPPMTLVPTVAAVLALWRAARHATPTRPPPRRPVTHGASGTVTSDKSTVCTIYQCHQHTSPAAPFIILSQERDSVCIHVCMHVCQAEGKRWPDVFHCQGRRSPTGAATGQCS